MASFFIVTVLKISQAVVQPETVTSSSCFSLRAKHVTLENFASCVCQRDREILHILVLNCRVHNITGVNEGMPLFLLMQSGVIQVLKSKDLENNC